MWGAAYKSTQSIGCLNEAGHNSALPHGCGEDPILSPRCNPISLDLSLCQYSM
jgi:hypothetical protein